MADVTVEAGMGTQTSRGMRSVVFVNSEVGYVFGINFDNDLDYMKTTDGGATWSAASGLYTGTVDSFDVWYDQWTPGDTGRIIHIAFTENGTDDVSYFAFNTVNDTNTSIVDVFAGGSASAGRSTFTTITKTRGGYLYCGFNIDLGTETGLYRSTDYGATWASRTNPLEIDGDQYMLFPANAADPNDVWMIYEDQSDIQLSIKTHDDSGNSNTESSTLSFQRGITDGTGQYGFSGSIRHSDGLLILGFFNDYDNAATDFLAYSWNGTNLTALTALTSNIDDMYYPSVFINNETNYIYIAYIGKSDGLETLGTTAAVYYALSTNNGVSWTLDIPYSESSTDYLNTWAPLNGDRFYVVCRDGSSDALISNHLRSLDFGTLETNNHLFPKAKGQNNTGIISIGGVG